MSIKSILLCGLSIFALAPGAQLSAESARVLQRVAAKVGPEIISSWDVEQAGRMVEAGMSPAERATPEGQKRLAEAKAKVLDKMIEEKLIILSAKEGPPGFKESLAQGQAGNNPFLPSSVEIEESMEKAFDEARKRFSSQDDFEAQLAGERLTLPEFRNRLRERVRDSMTFQRMLKVKESEFRGSIRVADEDAQAYFNEHVSAFAVGEQVLLRHIVLGPDQEGEARRLREKLRKAKSPKAEFIALARRYSLDELTKEQGGLLGWIERGASEEAVDKAAFAAEPGQVVGPLLGSSGWQLLFVDERKAGEQKTFEDAKAQIRNVLYQVKLQKRLAEWVEDLKRSYFVEKVGG